MDAEDTAFWQSLEMPHLKAVIPAMNDIEGKLIAARTRRQRGFAGYIIGHTMYAGEVQPMKEAGADEAP